MGDGMLSFLHSREETYPDHKHIHDCGSALRHSFVIPNRATIPQVHLYSFTLRAIQSVAVLEPTPLNCFVLNEKPNHDQVSRF